MAMTIDYRCGCGNQYVFADSRAGHPTFCPRCQASFTVPRPTPRGAKNRIPRGDGGDFVSCPSCGKQGQVPPSFRGKVITCKECGTKFSSPAVVPAGGPSIAREPPIDQPTEPTALATPAPAPVAP